MSSLSSAHLVALSIFVSYFVIIIGLFALILSSLYTLPYRYDRNKSQWLLALLAVGSLAHTWLHMIRFLFWSFNSYEVTLDKGSTLHAGFMTRLASWLLNTSLFEQAWAAVCFGPFNWWWSQQLCLYTVGAWTIFLAIKGRECRVKHIWAYMLLGQLVAISVASNLFYLALLLSSNLKPQKSDKELTRAPPSIYIPVFLSLAAVIYSPYTSVAGGTFLPNLLIIHTLIFIPLILPSITGPLPNMRLHVLALILSTVSIVLHVHATILALDSVPGSRLDIFSLRDWAAFMKSAWNTLQMHHPAQSSISWDVVWTSVSFIVWIILDGVTSRSKSTGAKDALPSLVATSLLSVGGVAPWMFGSPVSGGAKKD